MSDPKDSLQDRLAAMRERAKRRKFIVDRVDYVRTVPILAALEAAGATYDSFDYRHLSGILNDWSHAPARWPLHIETTRRLPVDPASRDAAIAAELTPRFEDAAELMVILRRESMVLMLELPVLISYLQELIDSAGASEIAILAPPCGRLVIVDGWTITVATLPVEGDTAS